MAHSGHITTSRYNHAVGGQTPSTGRFLGFYERQYIAPASDDIPWEIPVNFENKIDKIANKWYGEPRYSWVILLRNSNIIENPLTDLYAGRLIYIPSKTRLHSEILN